MNDLTIFLNVIISIKKWEELYTYAKFKNALPEKINTHIKIRHDADIIIVGSGVIGSVMAAVLGRKNYKVIVIERDFKQPSRIVGELLQPGGVDALKKLELESCLEGIDAQSSYGYTIHHNEVGTSVKLPYNVNDVSNLKNDRISSSNNYDNKVIVGKAFHHGRFIQNLRRASDIYNNVRKIEGEALKFLWDNKNNGQSRVLGVEYKGKMDGETKQIRAPLTIVVDGCFSKFRKYLFPPGALSTPQIKSYFLGLLIPNTNCSKKEELDEISQHKNEDKYFAEVVLANDPASVILIYKISSYYTRILIDIPCPLPKDIKQFLKYDITIQLPEKYRENFLLALLYNESVKTDPDETFNKLTAFRNKNLAADAFKMKIMPNSYLSYPALGGTRSLPSGVISLGDALNMRHPLTGGGMTVALNDAIYWIDKICHLGPPRNGKKDNYEENAEVDDDQWLIEARKNFSCQRSLNYSFAVNVLAQALYQLYASGTDKHIKEMREACFHYFEMGGICITGPMGIISITNPKPHILIGHFFAVALYAIYRNMLKSKFNIFNGVVNSWMLLYKACKIILPLIWNEFHSVPFRFIINK
ncbi:unnamed protein product [Gordionus sp. m RMFG-2023]